MGNKTWSTYKDFVVEFRRGEKKGAYHVLARGETGEAATEFKSPLKTAQFKEFLEVVRQSSQTVNDGGQIPAPVEASAEVGKKLHDALFNGRVRDIYQTALYDASSTGHGLRLQVRLAAVPELTDLPWEFLHNGQNFLLLSTETPLVYYLDLPEPPRPVTVSPPLRMLVTVSGPSDMPSLDVETEKARIQQALKPLIDQGLIHMDFASDSSLGGLQTDLRKARAAGQPYHIWHFIGHGAFDEAQADVSSVLVFADEQNNGVLVSGFQLGTLFSSYPETRLAVLNACQGARSSHRDPFNGVAAQLVEDGISAVIGMQFPISDSAAIKFSGEFYHALVDGLPIDAALSEARRAIFFTPNWVEWATPVLFMRVKDGTLFVFPEQLARIRDNKVAAAPASAASPAASAGARPAPADDDTLPVNYTNKMVYQAYPRRPGPDDTDLLQTPWFVVLKVNVGDGSPTIGLHLYGDTTIGRDSVTAEGIPMIALADYGAFEMGVSREHALFHPTQDVLYLMDNKSRNGVVVNNQPLIPGVPAPLRSGDHVRLAKLRIEVFILSQPTKS